MPVARYSVCEIAWHRWERLIVALCEVVPAAVVVPVCPALYRDRYCNSAHNKPHDRAPGSTPPTPLTRRILHRASFMRDHVCLFIFWSQVIVASFVRSNAEGTVGHLLRDWRRLNVALSRAKRKLVLVGSLRTLSSCAILSSLAGILKTRGWVYPLPQGAHRVYPEGLLRSSGGGYDREGALTEGGSSGVCGGRGELVPEMHAKSRRGQHNSEMYGRTRSEQDDRNRELRLASQCEGRGAHGVDAGGARGMDGGGGGARFGLGSLSLPTVVGGGGGSGKGGGGDGGGGGGTRVGSTRRPRSAD